MGVGESKKSVVESRAMVLCRAGVRPAGCAGRGTRSGCVPKVFTEMWEPVISQLGFHPREPFCCCAEGLGGAGAGGRGAGYVALEELTQQCLPGQCPRPRAGVA